MTTKILATMVVILPEILIELVGVGFGGVHLSALDWFTLSAILWVGAIPFAVLGMLVGSTVHAETAFPVLIGLMFVLGYFGGPFSPVATMPRALQVTAPLLPSFHNAALGISLLDGHGLGIALARLGWLWDRARSGRLAFTSRRRGSRPRLGPLHIPSSPELRSTAMGSGWECRQYVSSLALMANRVGNPRPPIPPNVPCAWGAHLAHQQKG